MTRVFPVFAASFFALSAHASDDAPLDFADVPEDVVAVAEETAPGVDFYDVSIERENGVDIYEFEADDHNGRHIEIDVSEHGSLEEIEMEIGFDEVPAAVRESLDRSAPGFDPDYVEFSVRDDSDYVYEFEGDYAGEEINIEITEDGEVLVYSSDALS
jgi:uncharacterized membrane protein YkoI